MAEPVDPETRLERDPAALSRRVLDGVLVLPPGDDAPLHLTTPGGLLWEFLAQPGTATQLAARLADRYNAREDTVRADIEPVLAALLDAGAIRRTR